MTTEDPFSKSIQGDLEKQVEEANERLKSNEEVETAALLYHDINGSEDIISDTMADINLADKIARQNEQIN